MKLNKKATKQSIDYKKAATIVAIIIIAVIIITIILNKTNNNKGLKINEFEKKAIYGYLEDKVLDVSTLYQKSGKSNFNDIQLFQSKLKQALDQYFVGTANTSVETSTILEIVDQKYVPENVDFHGVLVSGYEYDPEKDTFVVSPGAYENMSNIESEINNTDHTDKRANIQNIEKIENSKYKVTFNIVDKMMPENDIIDDTGSAILILKDSEIVIESCEIDN